MSTQLLAVGEGMRVFLNFSLSLEDGSEVDTNFGGEPVNFVIGDGSLLPGFESLLFGMAAGERNLYTVTPDEAFGHPNEDNLQQVGTEQFDDDLELQVGLVLGFADASGGEVPGMIIDFDDDLVTVDFNHPLAGRNIIFDVQIHRVEPAELH